MKIKKLIEEINNFDNIKDLKVVTDPITGDAIETSKKAQDTFDKVTTPFKKPIKGTKDDEKSKAADLKESIESDGWELEDSHLSEVLSKLADLKYEIDNCVRGSYATHGIDRYGELAVFVRELGDDLIDCAYELADMDDDEDMEESLKESFDWSNGSLQDFDPEDLMEKVKKRQMSLFTRREFGDKVYDISIHPHGRVDQPTDIWVDIISEDEQGNQDRTFLKKFLTYDEAINAMKEWKDSTLQQAVDTVVDEALNEDGRQNRLNLTPEQRAEEKAMAATLFDRVYNELEKDTDGSKNRVNKKASQRYNTEDISTDIDGNIVVYSDSRDKLQNAVNVAKEYNLQYKLGPGSMRNRAHAFQCVLFIPEEE